MRPRLLADLVKSGLVPTMAIGLPSQDFPATFMRSG
jgi:hypothetical protein